mmetsp:Transcript_32407/g.53593  ORF Transcript_32407/g.53593 Transcript_32407/m.53593 type:complete len:276 (-) Transcript_32407:23-850(-)
MGELHLVTISVNKVVINVLAGVNNTAVLVRENTNLDLGTGASAHWSGVKGILGIILRIVDHCALKELGGINVTVVFHVLNLLALIVARVAVDGEVTALTLTVLILVFIGIFFLISFFFLFVVSALITCIAHVLLEFLLVLNGGRKVGVEVDHVLTVVVSASTARVVWAELEDNKALGGKNSSSILVFSHLVVVCLDELALLELDRVSRDINLVLLISIVQTTSSRHQFRSERGLGVVAGLSNERIGSGGNTGEERKGKSKFHFDIFQKSFPDADL